MKKQPSDINNILKVCEAKSDGYIEYYINEVITIDSYQSIPGVSIKDKIEWIQAVNNGRRYKWYKRIIRWIDNILFKIIT